MQCAAQSGHLVIGSMAPATHRIKHPTTNLKGEETKRKEKNLYFRIGSILDHMDLNIYLILSLCSFLTNIFDKDSHKDEVDNSSEWQLL